jgi:hypothetical protein
MEKGCGWNNGEEGEVARREKSWGLEAYLGLEDLDDLVADENVGDVGWNSIDEER